MFDKIQESHVGIAKLDYLNQESFNDEHLIGSRGFITDQIHYFNRQLIEELKPEIAKYFKDNGLDRYIVKGIDFMPEVKKITETSIDDLRDLDLLIAAFSAVGFVKNGISDAYHNLEIVGESNCYYLTSHGLNNVAGRISQIEINNFLRKMLTILGRINFFVNQEMIKQCLPTQK